LARSRGALRLFDVGADPPRDFGGEPFDACDAFSLAAEFFVKHDTVEFLQPVFQTNLEIALIEEFGVGKPRADHALVAGDDGLAAVAGLDVGGEDELVDELAALGITHHKALLVGADGGADHSPGIDR